MSRQERIVAAASASEALISELTAEIWLNPYAAESFSADRSAYLYAFAAERGYAVPSGIEICDLELQASPVGEMDIAVPVHAQATTAERGCNSNDGSCGPPNSFFCISHDPSSCPSTHFDCPSQKCTDYPCGPQ